VMGLPELTDKNVISDPRDAGLPFAQYGCTLSAW
jgi:hypothetical protein